MSDVLLTTAELASLQDLAKSGMQTSVAVWKATSATTVDGNATTWAYSFTVSGWLWSTPSPVITEVSGVMALVNTYRLFVPVGTNVASGDHVVIGTNTYVVSDTTVESTYNVVLRCSLRFAE